MGHPGSKQIDGKTPGLGKHTEELPNQKSLRKLFVENIFQELCHFHKHIFGEILSLTIHDHGSSHAVAHSPRADRCAQIVNAFDRCGVEGPVSEENTMCLLENIVLRITLMISLVSSSIGEEGSDDSDPQLLELKNALRTYSGHLEKTGLLQRDMHRGSQLPTIEVIQEASNDVQRVLQIFPETTRRLHGASFSVAYEHVLCSILGLDMHHAEMLVSMDEVSRAHQVDQYWIEAMLDGANAMLMEQDEATQNDLIENLLFLGLTESRSHVINELLKNNIFRDHQSSLHWIKRYVTDAFAYHVLLTDSEVNPNSDSPQNGKISAQGTRPFPSPIELTTEYIYATSLEEMYNALECRVEPSNHYINMYHGTDRKATEHLIHNGIQLGKGSAQQEFSDGYGFYLTTNPRLAADWAIHSHFFGNPAIIKYKVPRNTLERFVLLDLDSCDSHVKQDIATYNRTGRDRQVFKLRKEIREEYEKSDYVKGSSPHAPVLTSVNLDKTWS